MLHQEQVREIRSLEIALCHQGNLEALIKIGKGKTSVNGRGREGERKGKTKKIRVRQCHKFFGIISAISTQRKTNAFGALYSNVDSATLFRNL